MKVSAWHAPDDGRPWYPVAGFDRINVAIEVATGGAAHLVVKLAKHPSHQRLMWWDRLKSGDWAPLVPWRHPSKGPSLDDRYPLSWRPLDGAVWPHSLPDPLAGPVSKPTPPEPVEPPGFEETDGWPYPQLRLGCRLPPLSMQEAEARVLRGLRRMQSLARVGHAPRLLSGDWPLYWYQMMRRLEDAERSDSHIGDVRVAWFPSRRDNTDWDYALDWWRQIDGERRHIIELRAANPVFSWRFIGERNRTSPETARQRYLAAMDRIFAIATGKGEG